MARALGEAGLKLLMTWEQGPRGGPASVLYLDSAGKETIGFGHRPLKGEDFSTVCLSKEGAITLLLHDTARFAAVIDGEVRVPLTQTQFDALVCFTFNVGASAFEGSTLLARLNAGDYLDVPAQLRRWNKVHLPDGQIVDSKGLTNRREAEVALWNRAA